MFNDKAGEGQGAGGQQGGNRSDDKGQGGFDR